MAKWYDQILNAPPISRIRRNHGLEHATLHILARQFPRKALAGYSNTTGFWILGDVPTQAVESAAREALERMLRGEHNLAVHPNCGTNFVTSGVLAGLAGASAMLGAGPKLRDKFERLSLAVLLSTAALIFAQPLGTLLQARITTSGKPENLKIIRVQQTSRGQMTAHRVITRG
jgi:hypothetical protein